MISRSFATVAALTILSAPLVLVAQRGPTSVLFGTKLISHSGFLDAPAVSPDGKWIAAMSQSASDNSIVIASATGGTFRPLVPAADRPLQLVWSPRGDRVAYMSGRVGGVVVSDFDTSTGALRGTPRRVTLERTWQYAIAPDGQSLAYVLKVKDEQVLKIVPLAGGTARDVLRWPAIALDNVRFAVDGKSLYFDVRSPTERGSVYRVSSTGGKPELVWKPMQPEGTTTLVEPSIDRILRLTQTTIVLMTLEGDTVLVMPNFTDSQLRIGAFSADGRSLFVAPSDVRAIMRATPLDGGKSVDLSPNTDYYWPVGWSSDSRSAYFTTEAAHSLYVAGLDGSARRTIAFDPQPRPAKFESLKIYSVSGDGRYLFVADRGPSAPHVRRAYLYDTQTRALRKVTDSLGTGIEGRGGSYLTYQHQAGEFVFLQRTGGTAANLAELPREIRAVKPDGSNRLVRRVPSGSDSASNFIVDGDRVYWTVRRNDTTSLFLARGAAPAAKIWTTTERVIDPHLSNDGTRMAVAISQPAVDGLDRVRFQFLRINASGRVTSDGQSATVGAFWDAYWAPGDQSLVALEYPGGADLDTRLIRIPANGGAVSYVVKAGAFTFWDHYLSPDGKYSLIPAESTRGASIWRIDLDAAQRDWKQRGGKK